MNPFEMVVIIVALGVLGGVISQYLDSNKGKKHKKAMDERHADMEARLEQAEQRIKILERIVTSEEYDLKRQFKDLEND